MFKEKIAGISRAALIASVLCCSSLNVHAESKLAVFAGTGAAGHSGDGGPAVRAQLNNPFGIARGPDGCICFCEFSGNVIRKVDRDGIITTIAGTGAAGYSGDGGPATKATMNQPHEIRFDRDRNLFVSHAIRVTS